MSNSPVVTCRVNRLIKQKVERLGFDNRYVYEYGARLLLMVNSDKATDSLNLEKKRLNNIISDYNKKLKIINKLINDQLEKGKKEVDRFKKCNKEYEKYEYINNIKIFASLNKLDYNKTMVLIKKSNNGYDLKDFIEMITKWKHDKKWDYYLDKKMHINRKVNNELQKKFKELCK